MLVLSRFSRLEIQNQGVHRGALPVTAPGETPPCLFQLLVLPKSLVLDLVDSSQFLFCCPLVFFPLRISVHMSLLLYNQQLLYQGPP